MSDQDRQDPGRQPEETSVSSDPGDAQEKLPGPPKQTAPPGKPNNGRKIVRRILSTLAGLVIIVLLLVALVLVLPWRLAAPLALNYLNDYTGLSIDAQVTRLSLFSGLTIENLSIKPPPGFRLPPLSAARLVLEYDLGDLWPGRTVTVERVSLTGVDVAIEQDETQGYNIGAIIDAFAGNGPPAPTEPEPQEEETGETAGKPFTIKVTHLEVGIDRARLKQPGASMEAHGLVLAARGSLSTDGKSDLEATLAIAADGPVYAVQRPDLAAAVTGDIRLSAGLKDFRDAQASLSARLAATGLRDNAPLPPASASLDLKAAADLSSGAVTLAGLSLALQRRLSLSLSGSFNWNDPRFAVQAFIDTLSLDLKELEPFALLFLPGASLEGAVTAKSGGINAPLMDLDPSRPPSAGLAVNLAGIGVTLPSLGLGVRALDGDLTVETGEGPGLSLGLKATAAAVSLDAMAVKGLALDLKLSVPPPWPTAVNLAVSVTAQRCAGLGVDLPLALRLNLSADPHAGELAHLELSVNSPGLARVDAEVSGRDFLKRGAAEVNLDLPRLPAVMAALPATVASLLPRGMKLLGRLKTTVRTSWKLGQGEFGALLPPPVRQWVALHRPDLLPSGLADDAPMRLPSLAALPVEADLEARLDLPSFTLVEPSLEATDMGIRLAARGTTRALDYRLDMETARATLPQAEGRNVRLSLTGVARPSGITAALDAAVSRMDLPGPDAHLADLKVAASVAAPARDFAPRPEGASATVALKLASAGLGPKETARALRGLVLDASAGLSLSGQTTLAAKAGLDRFSDAGSGMSADRVTLVLDAATGVGLDLAPGATTLDVTVGLGTLDTAGLLPFPLQDNQARISLATADSLREATLKTIEVKAPSLGLGVQGQGRVYPLLRSLDPPALPEKPNADLSLRLKVDNPTPLTLKGPTVLTGSLGLDVDLRLSGDVASVSGGVTARDFSLSMTTTQRQTQKDGQETRTQTVGRTVAIDRLNLDIPFVQSLALRPGVRLLTSRTASILRGQGHDTLYGPLRRWSGHKESVRFASLRLTDHADGRDVRTLALDETAMDLVYADNTFRIDRLHLNLLGGDVVGSLALQLPPDRPGLPRVRMAMQFSGVNLGYLEGAAAAVTPETEVSALLEGGMDLADADSLNARMDITHISLSQLDKLLAFLDPQGADPKIQSNRSLLSKAVLVRPTVELVAMWVAHENLNMDISIKSIPVVRQWLQSILDNLRLRRYSIAHLLRNYLPGGHTETVARAAQDEPGPVGAPSDQGEKP